MNRLLSGVLKAAAATLLVWTSIFLGCDHFVHDVTVSVAAPLPQAPQAKSQAPATSAKLTEPAVAQDKGARDKGAQDKGAQDKGAKEAAAPASAADPLDWPYWRGPEYNSISRETGLPDTIDPRGGANSNLLWKKQELGGRSTPIVLRGKL